MDMGRKKTIDIIKDLNESFGISDHDNSVALQSLKKEVSPVIHKIETKKNLVSISRDGNIIAFSIPFNVAKKIVNENKNIKIINNEQH